ncbi:MAG TPA: EAL domain-containing protein [Paucimonas sp.]|nr:EAL domain-containing protein [Paucimonas sp.]
MQFRSLQSRIATLFLLLILAIQLVGFFAIQKGIHDNARKSIQEELTIGERVFQRLLEQNAQKLTQGAGLLAADYGFKEAFGTNDQETIGDALSTARDRIGAALTMLIDAEHRVRATTTNSHTAGLEQAVMKLVEQAERAGSANGISVDGNHPYQIVVVPVKAPIVVAWVAMAFPIDQRLAADMRALSSLHVSVLTKDDRGAWTPDASTLPAAEAASLALQLKDVPEGMGFFPKLSIGDSDFSARIVTLTKTSAKPAVVVLQRSIDEAIAPYRQLQVTLLFLTAVGIAFAAAGSFVTARRITEPLRQLADIAKQFGRGEYRGQIGIKRADEIGDLSQAFESMRDDIAEREREIIHLAYWDTLTDLPNRAQFTNRLQDAIVHAQKHNENCTILMMDLDRFKAVNDALGHGFGDALLKQVAERLKSQICDETDHIARLGGDEFAILLPNTGVDQAKAVAARILKSFEVPISLDEQTIDLGAGIGIACYPEHGADAQALLSHAEVAMYVAKTSGNEAVAYSASIDKSSQNNLSLLSELRRAVDRNEFRLYVQPKVLLATGEVVGLEALIRWVHPERGMVFPDSFIPFAEQTGFIRMLTRWVLERSAALCADLGRQGLFPKISVNLSTRDLLDQDLPVKFADILARHKVSSSSFCLEITESAIMDDPIRALGTLEALHEMHAELAIDDFGTGYSSLAYLKRLPVDELKIDKSFVMKMESDADDAKIVRSTIDLGHNMGLRVVAEGLENTGIWHLLAEMGCDQGQGYFISKPMPAEQFAGWLAAWTPPEFAAAAGANA